MVATQRALLQAKRRLAKNSFAPKTGQVAVLESRLKPIMASLLFSIARFFPLAFTRVQSIFRQLGFSLMTLTASMVCSQLLAEIFCLMGHFSLAFAQQFLLVLALALQFPVALAIAVQFVRVHFQHAESLQSVVATQLVREQARRQLVKNFFAPKTGQVAVLEYFPKLVLASPFFSITQLVPLACLQFYFKFK